MQVLSVLFYVFLGLSVLVLITGPMICYLTFFENIGRFKVRALTRAESLFFQGTAIAQTLAFAIGIFTQVSKVFMEDRPIPISKYFSENSQKLQGDWAPGGFRYELVFERDPSLPNQTYELFLHN